MNLKLIWATNNSHECAEKLCEYAKTLSDGAVVFDIDETLVHNAPIEEDCDEFLKPVFGMPDLVRTLKKNNVKVVGCTARSDTPFVRNLTTTQLLNAGIILDEIHYMPIGTPCTHAAISRYKQNVRLNISVKYAPLHLVVGDQWTDLILCNSVNLIQLRLLYRASEEASNIAFKVNALPYLCVKCAFK